MNDPRSRRRNPLYLPGDTPEEKLLLNRVISPDGCWRWTGAHSDTGYGTLMVDGHRRSVHRLAHELWVGPIPSGWAVDHVATRGCVHRDCFNPAHLEAVTQAENNRRAPHPNAVKTHCIRGHEFTLENTYARPDGGRTCRECNRSYQRLWARQRRKALRDEVAS